MDQHLYSESRTFYWAWACWLIAIACAVAAVACLVEPPENSIVAVAVLAGAAVLHGLLGTAFARYFVTLENEALKFGYSFWNARILVSDVESATREQLTFRRWWGQGWRIDKDKRIGYIPRFGDGIELRLRSGRVYVLSCQDPEALVVALESTS